MTSKSAQSEEIESALRDVEQRFQEETNPKANLNESPITIPVVGEFSAGKSRLLDEMLQGLAPDDLLPVSSPRKETLLPLEVTYGGEPNLGIVSRPTDSEANLVQPLSSFPTRGQLEGSDLNLDECRLRLSVPAEELLWDEVPVPGFEGPARVYLLDTPGWNSGEAPSVSEIYNGEDVPAIIWVSRHSRLDDRQAREELSDLVSGVDNFWPRTETGALYIFPFVTRWESSANAREHLNDTVEHLKKCTRDCLLDVVIGEPLVAEFEDISQESLENLQTSFWNNIGSLRHESQSLRDSGSSQNVVDYVEKWELFSKLQKIQSTLTKVAKIQNLFDEKKLFPNKSLGQLKHHFDRNRDVTTLRARLESRLNGTFNEFYDLEDLPQLSSKHALSPWWNRAFLPTTRTAVKSTTSLLKKIDTLLDEISSIEEIAEEVNALDSERMPNDINGLNKWWFDKVYDDYFECCRKIGEAESHFTPAVKRRIEQEEDLPAVVAMLVAASSQRRKTKPVQ